MSDPARDQVISDEEARFFLDNGYLVLRGVLQQAELARLQAAMERLMYSHEDYWRR